MKTKIKRISAEGLKKNGTFTHELDAVNLIVGDNLAGKSSRLDAIRLALMGYLPELGKLPSATIQLACGTDMAVRVECDDGTHAVRRWESKRGKVKSDCAMTMPETPEVLMNPSVYFALSERERIKYVFARASFVNNEAAAEAICSSILNVRCTDHSPQHSDALRALQAEVNEMDDARHDAGQSVQDWIELVLLPMLKDRAKEARATLDRMTKTVAGVTHVSGDPARDRSTEVVALEAERSELHRKIGGLRNQLHQATNLEDLRQQVKNAVELDQDIASLTSLVEAKQKSITQLVPKADEANERLMTLTLKRENMWSERTTIEKRIVALKKEAADVLSKDACPCCGSVGKEWRSSFESKMSDQIDALRIAKSELLERLDIIEKEVSAATEVRDREISLSRELERSKKELSELQLALSEQKRSKEQAEAAARMLGAAGVMDVVALRKEADAAQDILKEIESKLTALNAEQRRWHAAKEQDRISAEAVIERNNAQVQLDILKGTLEMVEALQSEYVRNAFTGLLKIANRVCDGFFRTPLDYSNGEIGRWEGGQWISHRTFSGTEQLLAYAGLAAALAQDAPVRIVLMDELGRLDPKNRLLLLERMKVLVSEGVIDQFVGAAPDGHGCNVDFVNVIEL